MSDVPEQELVHRVKDTQDSAALTELINMHSGIYFDVVQQYAKTYPDIIKAADMSDDRMFNIYRFILDYKDDKRMKLSTYIGERTDYLCKTLLRRGEHDPISCGVIMGETPSGAANGGSTTSFVSHVGYAYPEPDTLTTSFGNSVSLIDDTDMGHPDRVASNDIAIEDITRLASTPTVCPDIRFQTILAFRKESLTWREIGKRMKLSHEMPRKIYLNGMERIRKRLRERDNT